MRPVVPCREPTSSSEKDSWFRAATKNTGGVPRPEDFLRFGAMHRSTLPDLTSIFARNKGGRQLFLEVDGRDRPTGRGRAGKDVRVAISAELAREVDELLGAGRVRLARI